MRSIVFLTIRLMIGGAVLAAPGAASACAVCGLDGDPGYFWSFLFLIGMPFTIAGIVGGVFFYSASGRELFRRAPRSGEEKRS